MAEPKPAPVWTATCPVCLTVHTFARRGDQMRACISWVTRLGNEVKRSLNWTGWAHQAPAPAPAGGGGAGAG